MAQQHLDMDGIRQVLSRHQSAAQYWLGRPVLAAALGVVLVGYPNDELSTGVRLANFTPADLGAILLVGLAAWRVLTGRDLKVLRSKVMLCPVLIVAVAAVTTAFSTSPLLSLVGMVRYAELFLLVPLAVVLVLRDAIDIIVLLVSIVGLALVEGLVGTYQSITKTGAGFGDAAVRAIGTFGVGNQLAMSTVISCAEIVLLAVAIRGGARLRGWALTLAVILAVPLLLSLSRGAVLALIVAGAVVLLSTGLLRAIGIGLIAIAILATSVALLGLQDSPLVTRFTTIDSSATVPDRSVQDRYDLWATAASIWETSPVMGVGIKQFPAFRDSHAPLSTSSGSDQAGASSFTRVQLLSPHNEYLLLLSEQGLLGIGGYMLLLVVLAIRHVSRLVSPSSSDTDDILRLASLGLFVYFAVDNVYGDIAGPTAVLFSLIMGLQLRSAVADEAPVLHFKNYTTVQPKRSMQFAQHHSA